jgi:hypothetical protein
MSPPLLFTTEAEVRDISLPFQTGKKEVRLIPLRRVRPGLHQISSVTPLACAEFIEVVAITIREISGLCQTGSGEETEAGSAGRAEGEMQEMRSASSAI